jgi:hypothetical protein
MDCGSLSSNPGHILSIASFYILKLAELIALQNFFSYRHRGGRKNVSYSLKIFRRCAPVYQYESVLCFPAAVRAVLSVRSCQTFECQMICWPRHPLFC